MDIALKATCAIFVIACCLLLTETLIGETIVSGDVSGRWDLEGSPYIIDHVARVPSDSLLIIDPGVEVWLGGYAQDFNLVSDSLIVEGMLIAEGTVDDSIRFLLDRTDEEIAEGIVQLAALSDEDSTILRFCSIETTVLVSGRGSTISSSLFCSIEDTTYEKGLIYLGGEDDREQASGRLYSCLFSSRDVSIKNASPFFRNSTFMSSTVECLNGSAAEIDSCQWRSEWYWIDLRFRWGAGGIVRGCNFSIADIESSPRLPVTNPVIEHCTLMTVSISGDSSVPVIKYNLIYSEGDGFSITEGARPIILNNTIEANTALHIVDIDAAPPFGMFFRNNLLVYCNNGYKAEVNEYDPDDFGIGYNILWQVVEPRVRIASMGAGDRTVNPLLREGRPRDYALRPRSPAIDSGDPDLPDDPDGTRCDIGSLFYDQQIDHPPAVISAPHFRTNSRNGLSYWAVAEDDRNGVELETRDLPEWLQVSEQRQSGRYDSLLIVGRPPRDILHTGFELVAIDDQGQTDQQWVQLDVINSPLSGNISGVLSRGGSPYIAVEGINVAEGDSLLIEPGVVLLFDQRQDRQFYLRNLGFSVHGTLICEGTADDSIVFGSNLVSPQTGSWNGLTIVRPQDSLNLSYLKIEHAGYVDVWACNNPIVRHCKFNMAGGYFNLDYVNDGIIDSSDFKCLVGISDTTGATVTNSIFRGGLSMSGGGTISNNLFCESSGLGIGRTSRSRLLCQDNEFIENRGFGCLYIEQDHRDTSLIEIRNCLFMNNDGLMEIKRGKNILFENNTIVGSEEGLRFTFVDENTILRNNIFANWRRGGLEGFGAPSPQIEYNLIWNVPAARVGDPVDIEDSIDEHPEFFGIEPYAYRLSQDSPAIDAGDPDSEPDPDRTRRDLGYHFYNQDNHSPIIDDWEPQDTVYMTVGASVNFLIRATDEDDDSLVYRWRLGDRIVGEEADYTFLPMDTVRQSLTAIIMDGTGADSVNWVIIISPNNIKHNEDQTLTYELSNAYPNPFNSQTFISFELPTASRVELALYDVTGRRVVSVLNDWRQAGHYRLSLQTDQIPSGFYILNMKSGSFNRSIRVVKTS